MRRISILILLTVVSGFHLMAQYAPAAGQAGSNAVHKDADCVLDWLEDVTIERGWMHCADTVMGRALYGTASAAGGAADGVVVSLGDGGTATYSLSESIAEHEGMDFAVYENAFNDYFLELAFVEVSSDGMHFVRFPSSSLTASNTQLDAFGTLQAEQLNNLAGKYRIFYGTPFDLKQLEDSSGLDIYNITHIRIIDVVGSIDTAYAGYDASGRIINDPWPTAFESSGFDLDAVAVLKANSMTAISASEYSTSSIRCYARSGLLYVESEIEQEIVLYDVQGRLLNQIQLASGATQIDLSDIQGNLFLLRSTEGCIKIPLWP